MFRNGALYGFKPDLYLLLLLDSVFEQICENLECKRPAG